MYVPKHFAAPDDEAVRDLLRHHGAADLVTSTADGLVATLLPFVYDDDERRPGPAAGSRRPQQRAVEHARARRGAGHRPRPGRLRVAVLVRHQARARPGGPDLELRHRPRARPAGRARRRRLGRGLGTPADREARGPPGRALVGRRRPARVRRRPAARDRRPRGRDHPDRGEAEAEPEPVGRRRRRRGGRAGRRGLRGRARGRRGDAPAPDRQDASRAVSGGDAGAAGWWAAPARAATGRRTR